MNLEDFCSDKLNQNNENQINSLYEFENIIGKGSFGTIWKCKRKISGDYCAIKIIDKTQGQKKKLEFQQKEYEIFQKLQHQNIVQFNEVQETKDKIYIVMEYIKHGNLQDLIDKKQKQNEIFSDEEASSIIKQILLAINYLHQKNIIHRDLKPENLLINNLNPLEIKLGDFGLSTQFEHSSENYFLQKCGTLIYMAPEFSNLKFFSKPVDVWNIGIITYQLLNQGKHPLYEKNITYSQYITKLKDPQWKLKEGISSWAKHFFLKLVALLPSERYTATQALNHPWITRDFSREVPLTFDEDFQIFQIKEAVRALIQYIQMLMFIMQMKKQIMKVETECNQENLNLVLPKFQQRILAPTYFEKSGSILSSTFMDPPQEFLLLTKKLSDEFCQQNQIKHLENRKRMLVKLKSLHLEETILKINSHSGSSHTIQMDEVSPQKLEKKSTFQRTNFQVRCMIQENSTEAAIPPLSIQCPAFHNRSPSLKLALICFNTKSHQKLQRNSCIQNYSSQKRFQVFTEKTSSMKKITIENEKNKERLLPSIKRRNVRSQSQVIVRK